MLSQVRFYLKKVGHVSNVTYTKSLLYNLISGYLFDSPLMNASVISRQMLSLNCLGGVLKK